MGDILERFVPSRKYQELYGILGLKLLSHCINVSQSAMSQFFLFKARVTRKSRNDRFKFLEKIAKVLIGAYNKRGVRSWFYRKRKQLNNRAPVEILKGEWRPLHPGPQKVLALAKSISDGNAA